MASSLCLSQFLAASTRAGIVFIGDLGFGWSEKAYRHGEEQY